MKRLNRKKIITNFEELRQGFRDVLDFVKLDKVQRFTFKAYHESADRMAVELGGETVLEEDK